MKLLSIVTPCLNRVEMIREAIESAMHQDYPEVEHIVIDGGSTDGTLGILGSFPQLRVTSAADRDVYDALYKGIKLAKGEVIGQLNSDDFYEPNIFKLVMQTFERNPEIDALVGGVDVFEDAMDGKRTIITRYEAPSQDNIWESVTLGVPLFNAWFFRRHVFERVGGYNINFHLASDRDFLIRFLRLGEKWLRLEQTVYHYRQHRGSLTLSGADDMQAALREEYFDIAERYIRDSDTPAELRKKCRMWHQRDTIEYCVHALYIHKYSKAFYYARRGMRYDADWLGALWRRMKPTLMRRLGLRVNGVGND